MRVIRSALAAAATGILVLGCTTAPPRVSQTVHHISQLALHEEQLFFGAGYCLYRLDVESRELDAILCTEDWTFQRPAVDGECAYAASSS